MPKTWMHFIYVLQWKCKGSILWWYSLHWNKGWHLNMMFCYTSTELQNDRKPPIQDGTQFYHLNWWLSPSFGQILPNRNEMTLNWCWPLTGVFNICVILDWVYLSEWKMLIQGWICFLCKQQQQSKFCSPQGPFCEIRWIIMNLFQLLQYIHSLCCSSCINNHWFSKFFW